MAISCSRGTRGYLRIYDLTKTKGVSVTRYSFYLGLESTMHPRLWMRMVPSIEISTQCTNNVLILRDKHSRSMAIILLSKELHGMVLWEYSDIHRRQDIT